MSADADSAYGKPWFRRTANSQQQPVQSSSNQPESSARQSAYNSQRTSATLSRGAAHGANSASGTAPAAGTAWPFSATETTGARKAYSSSESARTGTAHAGATNKRPAAESTLRSAAINASPSTPQAGGIPNPRALDNRPRTPGDVGVAEAVWQDATPANQLPALVAGAQTRMQQALSDQVTPLRLASHLSVLLVAAAVLLFSRIEIPDWDFQLVTTPATTVQSSMQLGSMAEQVNKLLTQPTTSSMALTVDSLQPQIVPFTIIPESTRQEIQVYSVQAGDTVLGIAASFKINPETLQWSNPALESNPDMLRINDQLRILPVDGVLHTVAAGDTLSALATRYKVDTLQIVAYEANNLEDANAPLIIGTDIVVPGGTKPFVTRQVVGLDVSRVSVPEGAAAGSGDFGWPASGSISQNFWGGHQALDIASRQGAPVKAADGGFVTVAGGGWNGGYGNHVIIDHGNGFVTLYAHLNTIFVRAGENVTSGTQIGTVGNTGNSTGPHLHFEIRYNGYPRNPYTYLP